MCAYSQQTGVKPFGLHRRLADMILEPMLIKCPCCDAEGSLTTVTNLGHAAPNATAVSTCR